MRSGVQLGHEVLDRGRRNVEVDRVELLEMGEDMSTEVLLPCSEGHVERIVEGGERSAERFDQPAATGGDRFVTALAGGTEPEVPLGTDRAAGHPARRTAGAGRRCPPVRQQVEDVVKHRSH